MIQKFVDRFMSAEAQKKLKAQFRADHPEDYAAIVRAVVEVIHDDDDYDSPDPKKITCVDYGSYRGAMVFVIGGAGYSCYNYWVTVVDYGSCSGCDTLCAIRRYGDKKPNDDQVKQYMTLALHLVQRMKCLTEDKDNEV